MISKPPLIEALADVRALKKKVFDAQLFYGYSGRARIAGGCIALLGAALLSQSWIPATPAAHVVGWGTICALSAIVNFIPLTIWWKQSQTSLSHLRPVLDLVAPFLVGGLLTYALLSQSAHDLLFPMWMWLFGLMNISSRHALPKSMVYLGWYYVTAGTICALFLPHTSFLNPLPMGIVFFIGEVLGGIAFIKLREDEI